MPSSTRHCCSSIKVHPLLHLLGCPSFQHLSHTQKPVWEWHLAHVQRRGKQRKIARERPSKFKSLVKEIALLTTHSGASATASDLPQSDIKTGIRVEDFAQHGYNFFLNSGKQNSSVVSVLKHRMWPQTMQRILFYFPTNSMVRISLAVRTYMTSLPLVFPPVAKSLIQQSTKAPA